MATITTEEAPAPPSQSGSWFDRYFEISARGSTIGREIRGGLATFFTMAYIVVLNPLILSAGADKDGAHLSITQVAAATALVAGVMTILMGVVGRFPLALAAGLGGIVVAVKMHIDDLLGLHRLIGRAGRRDQHAVAMAQADVSRCALVDAEHIHAQAGVDDGLTLFAVLRGRHS